jgi:hypothetical protein
MNRIKPFKGINHGTGKLDLTHLRNALEVRPVEIHLKEDGSKENKPSFCLVMMHPDLPVWIVGQLSLAMFNDGLRDIGYEMRKITEGG